MAGETTATTALDPPYVAAEGGFYIPYTLTYSATNQLELNDVFEAGWFPPDVWVFGFSIKATDMDTNVSPTLAQKISIGSTDLVTLITYGQTGTDGFRACTPTRITAKSKITVTNTAAAATAATGSMTIVAHCQK